MLFAAILIAAFLGRFFHGCLKYFVLAALLIWVSKTDPVLAHKLYDLSRDCIEKLREFVMEL